MMIVGGRHKRVVTQCIEPKRQALSIVACVCLCGICERNQFLDERTDTQNEILMNFPISSDIKDA